MGDPSRPRLRTARLGVLRGPGATESADQLTFIKLGAMTDSDRYRLLAGPYRAPLWRYGRVVMDASGGGWRSGATGLSGSPADRRCGPGGIPGPGRTAGEEGVQPEGDRRPAGHCPRAGGLL